MRARLAAVTAAGETWELLERARCAVRRFFLLALADDDELDDVLPGVAESEGTWPYDPAEHTLVLRRTDPPPQPAVWMSPPRVCLDVVYLTFREAS